MRLLRRNTTVFQYRAFVRGDETIRNGLHSGNYKPVYADPVEYRGNISQPYGYAAAQYFGTETKYTHTLLMDNPNVDIKEYGLIDWQGDTYEIQAVHRSINVLAVALRKRSANHGEPSEPVWW